MQRQGRACRGGAGRQAGRARRETALVAEVFEAPPQPLGEQVRHRRSLEDARLHPGRLLRPERRKADQRALPERGQTELVQGEARRTVGTLDRIDELRRREVEVPVVTGERVEGLEVDAELDDARRGLGGGEPVRERRSVQDAVSAGEPATPDEDQEDPRGSRPGRLRPRRVPQRPRWA